MLTKDDSEYLHRMGYRFEVTSDGGLVCLVINDWRLPEAYEPEAVDLLIRLPPGFPDAQPDMFWCDPPVRIRISGAFPIAADSFEQYLGRTWQRFSRHLPPGVWQPGRDSLESYMTLIRADLVRAA